jgi:hypothetical protein
VAEEAIHFWSIFAILQAFSQFIVEVKSRQDGRPISRGGDLSSDADLGVLITHRHLGETGGA